MKDFNGQDYGKCPYCNADRVLNPKTGKIFCKDKCWLKKGQSSGSPETQRIMAELNPTTKNESIEILREIRDLLRSIDKKTLLRDPETGDVIPF